MESERNGEAQYIRERSDTREGLRPHLRGSEALGEAQDLNREAQVMSCGGEDGVLDSK